MILLRVNTPKPKETVGATDVKPSSEEKPLEMTEADLRALHTDYAKGEVNREEANMYKDLLR